MWSLKLLTCFFGLLLDLLQFYLINLFKKIGKYDIFGFVGICCIYALSADRQQENLLLQFVVRI